MGCGPGGYRRPGMRARRPPLGVPAQLAARRLGDIPQGLPDSAGCGPLQAAAGPRRRRRGPRRPANPGVRPPCQGGCRIPDRGREIACFAHQPIHRSVADAGIRRIKRGRESLLPCTRSLQRLRPARREQGQTAGWTWTIQRASGSPPIRPPNSSGCGCPASGMRPAQTTARMGRSRGTTAGKRGRTAAEPAKRKRWP